MALKETNLEKLKALQLTLDKIEKNFGKGSIMKLGDNQVENIPVIPSGSIALDKACLLYTSRGEIKEFTGISSPFEAPEHPFISIDTSRQSLADSVKVLLEAVSPKITGNEFR